MNPEPGNPGKCFHSLDTWIFSLRLVLLLRFLSFPWLLDRMRKSEKVCLPVLLSLESQAQDDFPDFLSLRDSSFDQREDCILEVCSSGEECIALKIDRRQLTTKQEKGRQSKLWSHRGNSHEGLTRWRGELLLSLKNNPLNPCYSWSCSCRYNFVISIVFTSSCLFFDLYFWCFLWVSGVPLTVYLLQNEVHRSFQTKLPSTFLRLGCRAKRSNFNTVCVRNQFFPLF